MNVVKLHLFISIFQMNQNRTTHANGGFILCNLITFRKVGVKIIFSDQNTASGAILEPIANPILIANSTTFLFNLGKVPGWPNDIGEIKVLAS